MKEASVMSERCEQHYQQPGSQQGVGEGNGGRRARLLVGEQSGSKSSRLRLGGLRGRGEWTSRRIALESRSA